MITLSPQSPEKQRLRGHNLPRITLRLRQRSPDPRSVRSGQIQPINSSLHLTTKTRTFVSCLCFTDSPFQSPPASRNMTRTTQGHRRVGSSKPPATIPAASPASNSKLPAQVRFPLLVVLSLTISSFLYSLVSPFTSGDLATVSKSRDNWWEIVGLLVWKATQLAVGWYGGFDSMNAALFNGHAILIVVF